MQIQVGGEYYQIRKAGESDFEYILVLLQQAASWLQTKNTTQWDYYIHDLKGNSKEVLDSVEKGNTFLLEKDRFVIASITLENSPNEWDYEVWQEKAFDSGVIYLHRIVVNREYAGKGIGDKFIQWALDFSRNQGYSYIRFDCLASNQGLNDYYQKKYVRYGVANIYGQHSLYEIDTSSC